MPELPEVESIRRSLLGHIVEQKIKQAQVLWEKSFPTELANQLAGRKVIDIERRGKVLIIRLDKALSLLIHLKMSGQLLLIEKDGKRYGGGHPTKSMVAELPDSSTRVIFEFTNGAKLFFNDQRKFGWIKLVPNEDVNKDVLIARLGPEPLSDQFLLTDFKQTVARRNAPIKAVLLDQSTVAGIGNIYADEALHLAKIHPLHPASSLTKPAIEKLYDAIITVLNASINKGGTSFTNYRDIYGGKGNYLDFARVFRKQGQPCPVCGTIIEKTRVAGRGTHICPHCQKLRK